MKTRIWISLFLIILLTSGCQTPTATSLLTTTNAAQTVTVTPLSPTNTPAVAHPTATLTFTKPPNITPTFTLPPTLSIEDAKTLILELVQNPKDCQLPCLWGFIPGESHPDTAREFVERFGIGDFWIDDIELGAHNYDDGGSVSIAYPKNDIIIITRWAYNADKDLSHLEMLTMKLAAMEILGTDSTNQLPIMSPIYGDSTFNQEFQNYSLVSILTAYGQPSHVLLMARPDDNERPLDWYPFSLALVYPDQGIFVEYVSPRETVGNNFVGCPNKSHIYLATWDPQSNLPWRSVVNQAGIEIRMDNSQPLEEATALALDEFYQIFQNPENMVCLETPIEIWAGPP